MFLHKLINTNFNLGLNTITMRYYSSIQSLNQNSSNYRSKENKILIKKAKYNLNLLIYHNKNSHLINILQNMINKPRSDIYYINDLITKIYLSYSIHEALELLSVNTVNKNLIKYYENEYIYRYYDNTKLNLLFQDIETDIKKLSLPRSKFILLPFYYNIYLNQMK